MLFKDIQNPVHFGRSLSTRSSHATGSNQQLTSEACIALICRQLDDLASGCVVIGAVQDLVRVICSEDGIDLRDEGIWKSFNGVDIKQERDRYIKITYKSYIDKLLAHYGWSSSESRETDERPIKPLAASTTQQMFDNYTSAPRDGTPEYCDLETAAGFSYRSVLGAFIYVYVVT